MNLVVGLTLKIFIIMAIGFGAKKFGIIDEQCKDKMSSLLVNLLLPVSMLASSQQAFNMENLKGVVLIAVITVLYYVVTIVAGGFVGKIFGMDDAKSAMFTLLVAFANTGFVGLPILGTVAGKTGTLYGAVYNSVFDVLYFTYGIYLLSGEKKDGINLKKILLNPMIMVAVITIILYVVQFRMPMVVTDSLGLIGDCMMPVSMLLIGAEIASMNVKEILCDRDSYIVSLFRMLIIPFVMYILMVSLKIEHQAASTIIILLVSCFFATLRPNKFLPLLYTIFSGEFIYLGLLSSKTLPPNAITLSLTSCIGNINLFRKLSM